MTVERRSISRRELVNELSAEPWVHRLAPLGPAVHAQHDITGAMDEAAAEGGLGTADGAGWVVDEALKGAGPDPLARARRSRAGSSGRRRGTRAPRDRSRRYRSRDRRTARCAPDPRRRCWVALDLIGEVDAVPIEQRLGLTGGAVSARPSASGSASRALAKSASSSSARKRSWLCWAYITSTGFTAG